MFYHLIQFLPKNTSFTYCLHVKIVVFLYMSYTATLPLGRVCPLHQNAKNDDKQKSFIFYNYRRQELYMIEILIGALVSLWCWALHC